MTPRRPGSSRWPVALIPVALAVGAAAEVTLANAGQPADAVLSDALTGGAFIAAGLVAWDRRPANRTGPILAGLGFAWFGGDFLFSAIPLVGPASLLAQLAGRVLFAWLLLSFPSGRLGSPLHRAAVAAILAASLAFAGLQFVTLQPSEFCPCPENPFAVAPDLAVHLNPTSFLLAFGMAVALGILIVRRVALASGPARRTLIPVMAGGAFALLSVLPDALARTGTGDLAPISWLPLVYIALPAGFLFTLLSARIARGAVADLVIRLGSTKEPVRLRDTLAAALGDPTLEVLRWSPDLASYVGADGRPTQLPPVGSDRAVTVLETDAPEAEGPNSGGRTMAAIVHDPALLENAGLVEAVAAALRLAVENEQLQADVQAQLGEVRESRARIVRAGDEERRRLERDLHDGAQQRLVALSLAIQQARAQVGSDAPAAADATLAATLDAAAGQVRDALAELRDLARGMHPTVLTEAGLGPALAALARRSPVPVRVDGIPTARLSPEVEAAAYFVVSEGLANVAKHAPEADAVVRTAVRASRAWPTAWRQSTVASRWSARPAAARSSGHRSPRRPGRSGPAPRPDRCRPGWPGLNGASTSPHAIDRGGWSGISGRLRASDRSARARPHARSTRAALGRPRRRRRRARWPWSRAPGSPRSF
ncbi:MAG: hypothetical protein IT429_20940 [Gemmataceae bacterium]|nr:hypothetical protein [Gemmataceae bacterium]